MKKIAHVIFDEKFFDGVIEVNDHFISNCANTYFIVNWLGKRKKSKYIKNTKRLVYITGFQFLKLLKEQSYNAVFLYSIKECPSTIILSIPKQIKVFWFAMGYDLYSYPYPRPFIKVDYLLGPITKKIRQPLGMKVKNVAKYLLSPVTVPLAYKAMKRVDFFSGVLEFEYRLLQENTKFSGESVIYQYTSMNILKTRGKIEHFQGSNILIGNSAAETNNHLDILQYLKNVDVKKRKIVVPLSYGGWKTERDQICKSYENAFKDQFCPIIDFMPYDEYKEIVHSCSIAIFGHERQQAMGNINMALNLGCKVFLSETNPVYSFYKSLGFVVFSIQENLTTNEIDEELSESERAQNRRLLYERYHEQQFAMNMNKILNLF